jgi:hypothetical protein
VGGDRFARQVLAHWRIAERLGHRPESLFEAFDDAPLASGLVTQWHRARMPGGAAAWVELIHPELAPDPAGEVLRRLVARLVSSGELPAAAEEAVEELARDLDLRRSSLALEELADETAESRWIEVPRPYLGLCTPRVRVITDLGGRTASALAGEPDERTSLEARARRLGRGWLALALSGRWFPAAPAAGNVRHLASGRVAFLGGPIWRLPRTVQPELRDYLAAVAAKRPARAAEAFFDLLAETTSDRRLRDRLRHTEPFRDRGWDVGGDRFARQVLAHWRIAERLGHRLEESLLPFYRGLFLLNQEIGALAPHATPLRDGLREARLLLLFDELRDEAESGRWNSALERQLGLLGGMPQKLDRILTLAAEDDPAPAGRGREGRAASRRHHGGSAGAGAGPVVAACLLAITAVALLVGRLGETGDLEVWPERLAAFTVLLLGGALLRAVLRDGDG